MPPSRLDNFPHLLSRSHPIIHPTCIHCNGPYAGPEQEQLFVAPAPERLSTLRFRLLLLCHAVSQIAFCPFTTYPGRWMTVFLMSQSLACLLYLAKLTYVISTRAFVMNSFVGQAQQSWRPRQITRRDKQSGGPRHHKTMHGDGKPAFSPQLYDGAPGPIGLLQALFNLSLPLSLSLRSNVSDNDQAEQPTTVKRLLALRS